MFAVAILLLPLLFGQKITVSPLLLVATAVMPNFVATLIPGTDENGGSALFSRVFYLRVAASVGCAFLLLAIYWIAHALA